MNFNSRAFDELNQDEMLEIEGGIGLVAACILIGLGSTAAGFGIGYGLARWLG